MKTEIKTANISRLNIPRLIRKKGSNTIVLLAGNGGFSSDGFGTLLTEEQGAKIGPSINVNFDDYENFDGEITLSNNEKITNND